MSGCDKEFLALPLLERKKVLRKRAKGVLKELFSDINLAEQMSKSVAESFLKTDLYKNAPAIFAYMAMNDEIDLKRILEKTLQDGKKLYLPRMKSGTNEMDFYLIEDLNSSFTDDNLYKILEPSDFCQKIEHEEIDSGSVFLVPGLAFNLNGARLGRGKGYYDKYLSSVVSQKKAVYFCGVCSVNVITKEIPVESNDIFMTHILNEYGFEKCYS